MKRCLLSLLLLPTCIFSQPNDVDAANRIHAHLFIHDPASAVLEAKKYIQEYPASKDLQFALVRALCAKGEDMEAIDVWKKISPEYTDDKQRRSILEVLGWGVIKKSDVSSQQLVRISSLIGASLTNDARAIPILLSHLRGFNSFFRAVSVSLASKFGDEPLKRELERLLHEEKVWYVRLEVIKAVGQMRLLSTRDKLKEIIAHPKTLAEEKSAALISLASMYDQVEEAELKSLIKSDRAGLRQLACEVISFLELTDHVPLILPLLEDASPDVRISALSTLGLLRVHTVKGKKVVDLLPRCLNNTNPAVSITAGWLAILLKDQRGEQVLKKWAEDSNPENRRLASAALAKTGSLGSTLSWDILNASKDPYIRVNLALGLIGVRQHVDGACEAIYTTLMQEKQTKLMWDHERHFLFRSLAPSSVRHTEQIANYPYVVDQLTRLELLSILSVMRYPHSLDAVKDFLKNTSWGVSGAAAVTLLQEGDDNAFYAVKDLLNDPDEKLRIQAALILAMLGSDPNAVTILQEAYGHVDRDMKIHILEALAHIGDPKSIPFLVEILNEPFQVLRVIAASALIQCIYH